MTFEMIKKNYDRGLWNKQMVKVAVTKGVLIVNKDLGIDQYKEITGEDYTV